jgi:hypothetical protein
MIHAVRTAHLPQGDIRIVNSNLSRVVSVVLGGYVGERRTIKYQHSLAPGNGVVHIRRALRDSNA